MSVHEKMTAIADTVRGYTGKTAKLGLSDLPGQIHNACTAEREKGYWIGWADGRNIGGYQDGYDTAKQEEYDRFWDTFQKNGKRTHYSNAFAYGGWTDDIYNPKYPITPTNGLGMSNLFIWNTGITDTKVPITAYGACQNAFSNTVIRRIPKLIFNDPTNVSNMFLNCTELEEIRCEGEIKLSLSLAQSEKLSQASIGSLIRALAPRYKAGAEVTGVGYDEAMSGESYERTAEGYSICYLDGDRMVCVDKQTKIIYQVVSNFEGGQTLTLSYAAVAQYWDREDETYDGFDELCDMRTNWTITLV